MILTLILNEAPKEIDQICIKCGRTIALHPRTGRFNTIILYGRECALNPDNEFKDFVVNTLKTSGYDLSDFGLVEYYRHKYRRNDSNFVDRYSLNF